jgi:putative serine protease PepD
MINVAGQVVGIAMESDPALAAGGFGLNVADVQDDVQQILQGGQLVVPSMGATGTDVSAEAAAVAGIVPGSRLLTVASGGPAAAAGLKPGDVITQLDDVQLDAAHPLRLLLRSRFHANQRVTVTYWRAGSSTQAELTLTSTHPTCS